MLMFSFWSSDGGVMLICGEVMADDKANDGSYW